MLLPPIPSINKLVITNKKPSKRAKKLCLQLRRLLKPNTVSNLKDTNPPVDECLSFADRFAVGMIIYITDAEIQIAPRPEGPTFTFKILEYDEEFRDLQPGYSQKLPFVTMEGKSVLKPLFEKLGKNEEGFRRVLHFSFEDKIVYMRHYITMVNDTDDNWRVSMRETGPKLKLELIEEAPGILVKIRASQPKKKIKEAYN